MQQGFKLKIEKIEGELPLKWTLSQVHLELNDTDSIDIDQLRLRISILPLLRKHIGISYLSANKTLYRFVPKDGKGSSEFPQLGSFSIRLLKITDFEAINLTTHEKATYALAGNCHFKKRAKVFDIHAKVQSPDLDLNAFIQGDKKTNQIATDLSLHVKSKRAFAPFFVIPYETAFHLETQCMGSWKGAKPLAGEIKLAFQKLALPELRGHDENILITTHFALFSDRSFEVSSLSLKSDLLSLQGRGEFDSSFIPKNGECSFSFPHLNAHGDAHYTGTHCKIGMKSEQITVRQATFKDADLNLTAEFQQGRWIGTVQMAASHPDLGFQSTSQFQWLSPRLELQNFSFQILKHPSSEISHSISLR